MNERDAAVQRHTTAAHDEPDASTLVNQLASGAASSRQLVKDSFERIKEIDRQTPSLCAVIEQNPDALAIAGELDQERRRGVLRGPLHGIPVMLKDNIATGDRMLTTAGSYSLEVDPASRDSHIANLLRQRGLIIVGKTNLSEWSNFRSRRSTDGWSARGGLTKNPYCLDRTASGSSTGSAVAVAANYVALAVGTETNGSIVSPAQMTCTVGLKPTVGLVSRTGVIPISLTCDTAGPITRTVRDAALLLGALAGKDSSDEATLLSPQRAVDYTKFLDGEGLRGARIGVLRQLGEHPLVASAFEQALKTIAGLGAEIVDHLALPSQKDYEQERRHVVLTEFKVAIESYLQNFASSSGLKNLQDIVDWNEREAARELVHFDQGIFKDALATHGVATDHYLNAWEKCRRLSRTDGIEKLLTDLRLDALIAPTGDPAWLIDTVHGDRECYYFSTAAAIAGLPHLTVPMGFARALPIGLSFVGRAWSESDLLKFGYAFEQATKVRRPPSFMWTLGTEM